MILSLALAAFALPQVQAEPSPHGEARGRRATIGRIEVEDAPRIDGYFDDPCWETAPSIGELIQVEPIEGLRPGQDTVVKIIHDAENLYMGLRCFEDDMPELRATQQARDARLDPDDRFEWIFDPFQNQNQGYFFQIGAAGSLGDALVSPGTFTKAWDAIWDARVRIVEDGWQAEIVIPFRSIAFPEDSSSWGFNIRRIRRSTNESYRWSNASQSLSFFQLAEFGVLDGFGEIEQGTGIAIAPYVANTRRRERLSGIDWDDDPDAGGEVFVRLTPSLEAVVTFFTDFAQTENDGRQINLTRFPLFFPEKRDFFLQDASRFKFGSDSRAALPFFSRRIGIGDDGEIPVEVGMKVAGQVGDWGIGVLGIQTGEGGGNDFRRDLGVARFQYAVAEQTRVGVIGTYGRPTERGSNAVGGIDVFHRSPEFVGDLDLQIWGNAMSSQTSGAGGDGASAELRAQARGREWEIEAGARSVGAEFNPELGFVPRRGIQTYETEIAWRPRAKNGSIVRNWWMQFGANTVMSTSNRVLDLEFELIPFGFRTQVEDEFRIFIEREFTRIDEAFEVFDDIEVPAGDYWITRGGGAFRLSEGRPVSANLWMMFGDFFGGNAWETTAEIDWRTNRYLILGAEYRQTKASLFGRNFTSFVSEARVDVHLTPWLSILNFVQYDNESRNLGVQSRTRWIVEPGSDLFLVLTAGWLRDDDGVVRPDTQSGAVKFVYTHRF